MDDFTVVINYKIKQGTVESVLRTISLLQQVAERIRRETGIALKLAPCLIVRPNELCGVR